MRILAYFFAFILLAGGGNGVHAAPVFKAADDVFELCVDGPSDHGDLTGAFLSRGWSPIGRDDVAGLFILDTIDEAEKTGEIGGKQEQIFSNDDRFSSTLIAVSYRVPVDSDLFIKCFLHASVDAFPYFSISAGKRLPKPDEEQAIPGEAIMRKWLGIGNNSAVESIMFGVLYPRSALGAVWGASGTSLRTSRVYDEKDLDHSKQ